MKIFYQKYLKTTNLKCWAITGKGLCNNSTYVYLGVGAVASIGEVVASNVCPENGEIAKPYIDGIDLNEGNHEGGLKSGTESISEAVGDEDWGDSIVSGGCPNLCSLDSQKVIETDKNYPISVNSNCLVIGSTQICSDQGCPPPVFSTESNPCPPGTCPVECCGKTKCYTPEGVPIN